MMKKLKFGILIHHQMGYDASCFLIYGVYFDYDKDTGDSLDWLLNLIVPDLVDAYGDDVWACFDQEPHTNGYYCLNFTDEAEGPSQLFIACYYHEHVIARGADDLLEVKLPSSEVKKTFRKWLKENNIDKKPKLYTKLYESC